jgi:hypothetical protein
VIVSSRSPGHDATSSPARATSHRPNRAPKPVCSASARHRSPFYAPVARLRTHLLPGDYGHSFNFAPNANLFTARVVTWANEMVH